MSEIPTGTIVFMILLDLVALVGISVLLGVIVARAAGRSVAMGVLLGGLVPVIGPLAWTIVEVVRQPDLLEVDRVGPRTTGLLLAGGLLTIGGAGFMLCTPFAWGEVHGGFREYALATDASAADSWIGMFATIGTTLLIAVCVATAFHVTAWRRVAVLLILAGATWLAIAVNGLLVFRALDGLTETVAGASGGNAEIAAAPGTGLWLVMAAGALTLAGGIKLAFLERSVAPQPIASTAQPPPPEPDASYWGQSQQEKPEVSDSDYWGQPSSTWSTRTHNGQGF